MKVYFACSIRGGREDAQLYNKLITFIKTEATVLTETFADMSLTSEGMKAKESDIHQKDLTWVKEADVIIAEVSNPSLGVGYEIAKAEEWGKPVLALYRKTSGRKLSAMILGSPLTETFTYENLSEIEEKIISFLNQHQSN